jgi:hypothetical protein
MPASTTFPSTIKKAALFEKKAQITSANRQLSHHHHFTTQTPEANFPSARATPAASPAIARK